MQNLNRLMAKTIWTNAKKMSAEAFAVWLKNSSDAPDNLKNKPTKVWVWARAMGFEPFATRLNSAINA